MLTKDIIQRKNPSIQIIINECSEFLWESEGMPLYRMLPCSYDNIQRVKIRAKKTKDEFTETFNAAFKTVYNLRQRSLFAYGIDSLVEKENMEPFFVFPIDGYQFIYNPEVKISDRKVKSSMDSITKELMVEMLKYSYTNHNLTEGIRHEAEIIFFGIPAFYAAKCSTVDYRDIQNAFTL